MIINFKKIEDVFEDFFDHDTLEDRREYDKEMLSKMYDLNSDEASFLYRMIQDRFDPETDVNLEEIPASVFKEYVLDSINQNWEGFEGMKPVLDQLLMDLRRYAYHHE